MKALDPFEIELSGTTLIEASAGTGKTYTITTLFCRLIAEGYPVESILVVTFTEAAAAELKLRIRSRLNRALAQLDGPAGELDEMARYLSSKPDPAVIRLRLFLALSGFDQAAIMTIHAFCYKILKENAFESFSFFDMELAPDRSAFLKQVGCDFFTANVVDQDPLFLSFLASRQVTPESFVQAFKGAVSRPDLVFLPQTAVFNDFFDAYRETLSQIRAILRDEMDILLDLILKADGINKKSYSKKNVPAWLENIRQTIDEKGLNTIFKMTEKGDPLYKFTLTRMQSQNTKGTVPEHEFFRLCDTILEYTRQFETNLIFLKTEFFSFFSKALENIKQEKGTFFFDDLVNDLAAKLYAKGGDLLVKRVRQMFRACLIDEFQDTDPQQYKIFSVLFSRQPFFMIGDPKQAIYAFRGGDIFAYMTASRQSRQQFTLTKNYRSAPLLVEGVSRLFSNHPDPFGYEQIKFVKVSVPQPSEDRLYQSGKAIAPLQFCFVGRHHFSLDRQGFVSKSAAGRLIPAAVAQDMAGLLSSNVRLKDGQNGETSKIFPADIAVLVRTNQQAEQVRQALSRNGIPSYLSKTGSVFDSIQATELLDILCAVHNPGSIPFIKTALCTSVFNFTLEEIRKFDQDRETYYQWQDFFRQSLATWKKKGFAAMMMSLLHTPPAFLNDRSHQDERSLTNFYHLMEMILQADQKRPMSTDNLIKWYSRQLLPSMRDESESSDELRLETDRQAVAIVTIHKSKGLEYPVVFLPYLWEGMRKRTGQDVLFHDPDHDNRLTLDLGSASLEASLKALEKEEQAEQMRLLYVALTRASAMCRIFWGGFSGVDASALSTLIHPSGCSEDDVMIRDLEKLSHGCASVSLEHYTDSAGAATYQKPLVDGEQLAAGQRSREVVQAWRMSSFSAIAHTAPESVLPAAPGVPEPEKDAAVITLAAFPKGAAAGDFFHAVFETLDFQCSRAKIEDHVKKTAGRFAVMDGQLRQMASRSIEQVLATRLGSGLSSFSLSQIPFEKRLNEMEFTFPVESLKKEDLVNAFRVPGAGFDGQDYPGRLARLEMTSFSGYLKGFIDLVIEHDSRYYIIDYKSNYLGGTYDNYDLQGIQSAMAAHHYYLQYHIYLVALHRYLAQRQPSYDYDRHFGGVFYLFIRGMHPDFDSKSGVFYDRPSRQTLTRLSRCFA